MCPYCDPNYKPYPNVDESCRGYDVPMGNPMPSQGKTDPGISIQKENAISLKSRIKLRNKEPNFLSYIPE